MLSLLAKTQTLYKNSCILASMSKISHFQLQASQIRICSIYTSAKLFLKLASKFALYYYT